MCCVSGSLSFVRPCPWCMLFLVLPRIADPFNMPKCTSLVLVYPLSLRVDEWLAC